MATPVKTDAGTWRIQIEVRGQRESGTFPTKREATEWAAQKSTEIRAMASGQAGTIKTLSDALKRYGEEVSHHKRGWAKELIRLKAFEQQPLFPGRKRLNDLAPADITSWRDARLKINARGSVLRDMTLLSSVLEVARRDWQWIARNPMADVRRPAEPDHRERVISGPEVRRLLRQLGWRCDAPARTVSQAVANCFLVALATGMRAGELCGLTWSRVNDDHVSLQTTKSGKPRDVPLTPTARRAIGLMRGFDDALVFGLQSQSLDALFRKARGRAGLDGFTFHDARHTAATRLAQRLHVLDLCKMFGWSSTTRALTYYNPTASDIARRLAPGARPDSAIAAVPTRSPR